MSTTQHGSTSTMLSMARKLGNQQMQALALQLHAQQRNAKALPHQRREELEREAERTSEAAVEPGPRETPPAERPSPPPADASAPSIPPSPPSASGGDPLPSGARARFEARFGERFDDVRIHADAAAAREADMFGARAFTRGSHIYFAHPPDAQVAGNDRLIAHELAHVIQQHHQPALTQQVLLDDKPPIKLRFGVPSRRFDVKLDRELTGEELLFELFRQHFNCGDHKIAQEVIDEGGLSFPEGFVVPEASVKQGVHKVWIQDQMMRAMDIALQKRGIKTPNRDVAPEEPAPDKLKGVDADRQQKEKEKLSKELEEAKKRHQELMPADKALRALTDADLAKLKEIIKQLEALRPDQRKLFHELADPTDDLDRYAESLRSFSEAVAGAEEALRELAAAKANLPKTPDQGGNIGIGAKGGGDELQQKLDATWKNVDAKTWGGLDAKGREDLARRIAAEQRNIQLKHMVTHPGETVKGMAESVVRVDKLGKDIAKDVSDVADSSKSASARAAAASSAGKKVSMWLSAAIAVLTIIAFIVNPAMALKVWMMRAMVMMIIGATLAAVESELRIQEAVGAKDYAAFQEAVQKAASAQAEFMAAAAMAALPLVGRILVKIPFVGRVAGYVGKVARFGADRLWTLRNAIAKELRDLVKGTTDAVKAEGAATTNLANQLKLMTPEEFLEAIKNDKDVREALGFDGASVKQLDDLLKTPEGKKILDQLHKEITKSVEDAPRLAERLAEDYIAKVEEAAKKIENAKTPDEVKAAVDEANRLLNEHEATKSMNEAGEKYKTSRLDQAAEKARVEALAREAELQRAAAEKAAAEKAAAEKAAAEKAAAEKTAAERGAAEKAAKQRVATEKAAAEQAAADKAAAEQAATEKPVDVPPEKPKPVTDEPIGGKPSDKPTADIAAPAAERSPLSDVKASDIADAVKEEAKVDPSRRMSWDDAGAQKLDKRSIPADVKKAGLGDLWKEWVDYVRGRLKSQKQGLSPRRPLTWEAYRDFLGKFRRGRIFQEKFTTKLQGEVGKGKTVQQDVGVVSETLEKAVLEGKEGVKFADQVVADDAAVKAYSEGKGPAPDVETFSNKSRDFAWHEKNGSLKDIVRADVEEVLTKYGGKITIRRPGPLQGVKVNVSKATLVYDASYLPSTLRAAVREAFEAASQGRVKLRIE